MVLERNNSIIKIHKKLTLERWFEFSLMEQLANVGCDVDRAIRYRNKGEFERSQVMFEVALELLHMTLADDKLSTGARKELLIVREALYDYFTGSNEFNSTDEQWYNYFIFFNHAAAIQRGK